MKIMLCFDNSEEAKHALTETGKRAKAFGGKIVVVTSVIEDERLYPKKMVPHEEGLEEAKRFFDERQIPCEVKLSFRNVDTEAGEDLLMLAELENIDELVVGITKRSKLGKMLMGSVAQFLILKSNCPVLCVK